MLKFIGSTFLFVLKPAVPCRPRNEAKQQFGSSALSSSLAEKRIRICFGIVLDISGIDQDPKTCRLWGKRCFFYGSMEYIATLKWPHQKRIISERNHARRGLGPCLGLTIVNPADEYWDWDLKPQELDGSITEAKLLNKRYPRICLDCSLERFLCKANGLWSLRSGVFIPANLKVMTVLTLATVPHCTTNQSLAGPGFLLIPTQRNVPLALNMAWSWTIVHVSPMRNQILLRKISITRR